MSEPEEDDMRDDRASTCRRHLCVERAPGEAAAINVRRWLSIGLNENDSLTNQSSGGTLGAVSISRVYQEPTGRIWHVDQSAEVGGGTGEVPATTHVVLQLTSHTQVRWHHRAPRDWAESPASIRAVFLESVRSDAGRYVPLNTETTIRRCMELLQDQAVEEIATISSHSLADLRRLFYELLVEYRVQGDGRFAPGDSDMLRRFGMGLCAAAEETFDQMAAAELWGLGRDVLELSAYINGR